MPGGTLWWQKMKKKKSTRSVFISIYLDGLSVTNLRASLPLARESNQGPWTEGGREWGRGEVWGEGLGRPQLSSCRGTSTPSAGRRSPWRPAATSISARSDGRPACRWFLGEEGEPIHKSINQSQGQTLIWTWPKYSQCLGCVLLVWQVKMEIFAWVTNISFPLVKVGEESPMLKAA